MKKTLFCSLVLLSVLGGFAQNKSDLTQFNIISSYFDSFNDDSLDSVFWTTIESDGGITVVEENEEIKVSGVSLDSNWGKNGLRTPMLNAEAFDVAVDFELINATNDPQSINLRVYYDSSYFGLGYDDQLNEYFAYYYNGTGYHRLPNTLHSEAYFDTLRIVYDDVEKKFQGMVDNILIGDFFENEFDGVFYIQFHQESQVDGSFAVDVRFDNFEYTASYPQYWECWDESCGVIYEMTGLSLLSNEDGWAVGWRGISHWDGNRWKEFSPRTPYAIMDLNDVDMVSESDGWAVGYGGRILHWDGMAWSLFPTPTYENLMAIDMVSSMDGWAVGGSSTIMNWDGSGWRIVYQDRTSDYLLNDVEMVSATEGWIVGSETIMHWNGSNWSRTETPDVGDRDLSLYSISMLSASDGWAAGDVLLHWDGIQWELVDYLSEFWWSIDMVSSTDGWGVGNSIWHWDGTAWNFVEDATPAGLPPWSGCYYYAIEMVSADDGWVFGSCGVKRWDGNQWQALTIKPTYNLNSISMGSRDYGWAVGDEGLILGWDGDGWENSISPTLSDLMAVDTVSDSLAIAVGNDGVIIEWDGMNWQPVMSPIQNRLTALDLSDVDEGWAVGEFGEILRWDGEGWMSFQSPTSEFLYGVKSLSPDNAWAVGSGGVILHWDGIKWELEPSPVVNFLYSISFILPDDGWAVGGSYGFRGPGTSSILHWDGSSWTSYPYNFGVVPISVDMVSQDVAWAVDENGTILQWNGQTWRWDEDSVRGDFRCVDAIDSNNGWIVGQGGIFHFGAPISKIYIPMLPR